MVGDISYCEHADEKTVSDITEAYVTIFAILVSIIEDRRNSTADDVCAKRKGNSPCFPCEFILIQVE